QRVVDGGDTVLPIRFGTTFGDEDELRSALLEPNAAVLGDMLDQVRGKVEVQVKATYVEDAVVARAVAGDRRVERLKRSANLDARVELGRRVAENIERQRYSDARVVVDVLGQHAQATSLGDPTGEYGLVNVSFLVDREGLAAFDDAFERLQARVEDLVRFRYVGPLPPYSFVDASALTVARWA
ncbi:MAG: GvpL/GvpF family gas vesicle protein, partial [Actinomycetota bacterium]|nr:GvpL/GvpF family gas vesicle protein [Actinomycetota bacterium]